MEYVDGVTLKEYMKEHRLPLNVVLEIAVRLADALQHAHRHNIIHCDIKPQNILLDKNMTPKIADFGIAKMVSNQTMVYTKEVMGSVHYISPEQASGGNVTACSDVYSLGVVIFEMLTGQVPYTGGTAVSVAMMHVERPIPRLSDYLDDVPEGLQEIIDKTMAKRSEDRYSSARELRHDLMQLKMRLFPFSSEDYKHELSETIAMPMISAPASDNDATLIMNPVRAGSLEAGAKNNSEAMEPEKITEAKAGEGMPRVVRKWNFTNILLLVTIFVVVISLMAHFFFGRNREVVVVPNVLNMTVVEAQRTLEEHDFDVELNEEYGDSKSKPGTVMEQSPKAGEKRKEGSLIILTISRGAELKAVPNLTDMSLHKAEQLLLDDGFKLGKVVKKYR
ncbi:serine/threonine-protein kinase PrkC [gut metagenome]|uniref:non-specific serine/threonine protein kinase n=1 Tax=gut metagenome TaxID=749906 RepID=J9CSV4_9ZZZZ